VNARRAAALVLVGAAFGSALTALLIAVLDSSGSEEPDTAADDERAEDAPAEREEPEPRAPDRDLVGDCVLAGSVQDTSGTPIEDAWVRLRLLDEPWPSADLDLDVRTDEAGRFSIEGLTREARYHLWAWADGYQAAGYEDAQCGSMSDFALEPGASLSMAFADAKGDPVGPVEVVIAGSELWPPRTAVTGAGGEIEIVGLAPGFYVVWGTAGDSAQLTDEAVEVAAGERYELALTLAPAEPAAVKVLDAASGKPLGGASVLYGPAATSTLYRVATTDRAGRAEVTGMPSGEHAVTVVAPGYVTSDARPLQPGEKVEISLQHGAVVSGSVLTLDGAPVAEARIAVEQDLGSAAVSLHGGEQRRFLERMVGAAGSGWPAVYRVDDDSATPGPPSLPVPAERADASATAIAYSHWRPTDAEGTFRVDGLPGGRLLLGASHPRYVLDEPAAVTLESGGSAGGVVIRMRPGCTVSIRTLDERGYPIRGAEIKAYDSDGETLREAVSGTDGFAELVGLPTRFDIVATADERAPAVAKMRARPGKHLTVEITLPTADKQILGRVVDERGYGVGQVSITARAATRGLSHVLTTETADDGSFVLENAGSGAYRVTAEIGGRVRAQVMSASYIEGLKLVISGAGGPGGGGEDLGFVTPEMLAGATGEPGPDNLGVTGYDLSGEVGDQEPGIIAITETEERDESQMSEYGLVDVLPVTGPPSGKGGLPIKLGGGPGKVVVKSVQPGSRVAQAGLAAGDRIVAVDGVKVSSPAQARNAISGPVGSVVMLEVDHGGERVNVVVQRVRVLAQ